MGTETLSLAEYRRLRDAGKVTNKGRIVVDSPAPKVSASKGADHAGGAPKRNKYGAIPRKDPDGGQQFPSTFEFNTATDLRNMVKAGLIISVGRQVLVLLPGGITWQIDFILHHLDGSVEYVEAKGKDTPDFIMKEKLFREKYPDIKLSIQRKRARKKKA